MPPADHLSFTYPLILLQHCYKEEDSKRSALAQKAAAACATNLNLQGAGLNMSAVSTYSEDSNSSISYSERNITSPVFNQSTLSWKRKSSTEDKKTHNNPTAKIQPRNISKPSYSLLGSIPIAPDDL